MNSLLRQKLQKLPSSPGIYFYKNSQDEIIYIGKASILKNRVRQYFQHSIPNPKTQALVQEIADIDWITVDTELDALFLESEMIKRYLPKWNILLRDDKNVSYVRINFQDTIPFISFTRNPLDDQATYFGPFYSQTAIKKALRYLRRIFPYYDRPYNGKKTLNTDLGLTPGIEINKTTPAIYHANLKKLTAYLQGQRPQILKELKHAMQQASKSQNYELAATIRNQLTNLQSLNQKIVFSDEEFFDLSSDQALVELQHLLQLPKPPHRIEGYDISHHSGTNVVASMVVFTNGLATRTSYRKFKLKKDSNNDFANLREILTRRFKHSKWPLPDLILIDGGAPQLRAVQTLISAQNIPFCAFTENNILIIPTPHQPQSFQSHHLPTNSHALKLLQRVRNETHRFAIAYHSLLKRQNLFK